MDKIRPGVLIGVGVVLVISYAARQVVMPLLAAFLAAFIFEPLIAAMARKVGRPMAVAITIMGLATATLAMFIFITPKAMHQAVEVAQAADRNVGRLNDSLQRWMTMLPEEIKTQLSDALSAYSGKIFSWVVSSAGAGVGLLGKAAAALSQLLLFFIGFVFLMLDFPQLKPGLLSMVRRMGGHSSTVSHFDDFVCESNDLLRAFFRGQLLYAGAIGSLSALGLWAVGLPYGLIIGISVGFLSMIPYAGVAVGLVVALGISFFAFGLWTHMALTAGVFALVQALDAVYLTPKLLGGSVGLHPLVAVVALLAFSQLFGLFGLLMAIPLAAITLAAVRRLLTE